MTACIRCHRQLRDPVSVQAGIGPVCRAKRDADREQQEDLLADRYDLPWDPTAGDVVCKMGPDGVRSFNLVPRHRHHSPRGWAWGYQGSGPSDFALAILDYFIDGAKVPKPGPGSMYEFEPMVTLWDKTKVHWLPWDLHHAFKRDLVATLPEAGGVIPGATIRQSLEDHGVPTAAIR